MKFSPIPSEFLEESEKSGVLTRVSYFSESYDDAPRKVEKQALVYLPYGYNLEPERRYKVLYLMHGGGGNENDFFGGVEAASPLKNVLDNSFASGAAEPMIVVAPTFSVPGWKDDQRAVDVAGTLTSRFPTELRRDLIDAVDSNFRTLPHREARAFGGFSMGSECTWRVMAGCLDLVSVFMPLSGDYWVIAMKGGKDYPAETADALVERIRCSGVAAGDYRVLAFTGDGDIAYAAMDPMIRELRKRTDWFTWSEEPGEGNLCYCLKEGGLHTYDACYEYIRLALPHLFTK